MSKVSFEFSAGGVALDGEKVLVIKTKNLKGKEVWTFPKGNLKKDEKSEEAAIREVFEETGWRCEVVKMLQKVEYFYKREGNLIKKSVYWYLMKPIKKEKEPDFEVLEVTWKSLDETKSLLTYKSDIGLLNQI